MGGGSVAQGLEVGQQAIEIDAGGAIGQEVASDIVGAELDQRVVAVEGDEFRCVPWVIHGPSIAQEWSMAQALGA